MSHSYVAGLRGVKKSKNFVTLVNKICEKEVGRGVKKVKIICDIIYQWSLIKLPDEPWNFFWNGYPGL